MDINNKDEIDRIYKQLSPQANLLYNFVMSYSNYIYGARDYGTGLVINMVEVHTLTMIEDNPGITVSELAKMWNRTKGAASQNVSKLVEKDLVYRKIEKGNKKLVHLYPTEEGVRLSIAHKIYDTMDIMQTQSDLLRHCTMEEINHFYKVLGAYYNLF